MLCPTCSLSVGCARQQFFRASSLLGVPHSVECSRRAMGRGRGQATPRSLASSSSQSTTCVPSASTVSRPQLQRQILLLSTRDLPSKHTVFLRIGDVQGLSTFVTTVMGAGRSFGELLSRAITSGLCCCLHKTSPWSYAVLQSVALQVGGRLREPRASPTARLSAAGILSSKLGPLRPQL